MAFTEGLSDDGMLSGPGSLWVRGVVIAELLIAWIRNRFMGTPLLAATFQVVVGGVIVIVARIQIGES
jgi:hypothetical protein